MKTVDSSKSFEKTSRGIVYPSTCLRGFQEQALLHRLYAELVGSSGHNRVVMLPYRSDTAALAKPEEVLEILDGALCIIAKPLPVPSTKK